ncbi:shikimate kinase [Mesonia sp. K4-1]|uniref:shikimate kinase n=1 Tax=Mesonia sp. K4-1 TaxID=2602760 RepID=UPI0011C8AAC9|nr:shikimate kinase [Mesonia sp. K4-1]TXK72896.1 AAA family ATPase [Mesonia sp. K4-1]
MKIVLCGYMGSGKSQVGKLLASKLGLVFFDLDDQIEINQQKSIKKIFSEKGEIFFRKKENEVLKELLNAPENFILSLGGGTPCYADNLEILKNNKEVRLIYLKVELNELTKRLFNEKEKRPLISGQESRESLNDFIRKHLFERQYYYLQSDIILDVSELSIEETVNSLVKQL